MSTTTATSYQRTKKAWAPVGTLGVALVALSSTASAQDTIPRRDTVPQKLAPVVVTVTREAARSPLELPYAITSTRPDSARPGQTHMLLTETLLLLPGVTVANRNNPAQDPRVSIRGFGARSGFGVRGVRVMRDGMPLTLPDGQTPVDYLDLESVGSVEVIRGSASALYGNAAGGVIDVRSSPAPIDPFATQLRGWSGSYGTQRWVGALGGTQSGITYQANVSRTTSDGYRDHARQRVTSGYGRVTLKAWGTNFALQVLGYDMPLGLSPGSLTRAQFDSAPEMADPLSVRRNARKEVSQVQVGLLGQRALGEWEVNASLYGGTRSLYNPLPTFIGDVDRASYGGGARATVPVHALGLTHRLSAGVDLQRQNDDRLQYANCNDDPPLSTPTADCPTLGSERGVVQRNQREIVSSVGPFIRNEIEVTRRLALSLGVRADYVRFEVQDHLVDPANGEPDESGHRTLSAVSPIAGVVVRISPLHAFYANVSTAFETPTATELGNKPDGSAGINRGLDPQKATTYEAGLKGLLFSRIQYDIAGFDTRVRDELIPFEIAGSEGRQFYRNAGRTRRRGAELGLSALVGPWELGASYSYAHFRFREFTVGDVDYAGNAIPGIPKHQFQASATWRHRGMFATAEGIAQSGVFVDDANSERAPGYGVANLRFGGTAIFGRPWLSPVFGVQNLFDRRYAGSVNINAARGRFYEPAPERTVYGGLTLAVGR